jgi:hypothetical protein
MSFIPGTFQGEPCLRKTFCFNAMSAAVTMGADGSLVALVAHEVEVPPLPKARKSKNLRIRQMKHQCVRRELDLSPAAVLSTQLGLAPLPS